MTHALHHCPSLRRAHAYALTGLLFMLGALLAAPVHAESEQLNGSWVLDEAQSETYKDAVKVTKDQMMKLRKRRKKQEFSAASNSGGGGNKYYQQERNSNEIRAEDTIDVDWSLPGPLESVLEGKTVKIYQSNMCVVLYDKKLKRLFAINPEGNSYSAKGTSLAHDDIGRTFGYFEGKTLVIDTDVKGGDRLLERLKVDDSGNELTIETKYRRTDLARTLQFKRVFRRGE